MDSVAPGHPGELAQHGYVVLTDAALGISDEDRHLLRKRYFTTDVLRRYPNDIPHDRLRARDVLRYDWTSTDVTLREHTTIDIIDRGGHAGTRTFHRTPVATDDIITRWVRGILHAIPPQHRQPRGTFGLNFFRTFTDVVTEPHQDGEEYIVVYVIAKSGTGAMTELYDLSGALVLKHELLPGELILFRDDRFRHNATPSSPSTPPPTATPWSAR
ncbi:2OG-Fe dioxygenase family protein [Actinokineospora soli]|uniref:2OG-Fe dioxygenase family protein n=1 Tax=Actinokineospora soli TaxID=1048753 RepID=A0ABW2TP55_9PSEU